MLTALLLSSFSSLLTLLIFPKFGISSLAWFCLAPVAVATFQAPPRRAFFIGWWSGSLAYCGVFYWLWVTYRAAHQPDALALLSIVALSSYLGLFWGAWTWFLSKHRAMPSLIWSGAAAWTTLEFLRTHLFSGFPWALLSDSQIGHLSVCQIAHVTGAYGVSFLLALSSLTIAKLIRPIDRSTLTLRPLTLVSVLLLLLGNVAYGHIRLRRFATEPQGTPIRVALLQGDIDQYKKWNKAYVDEIKTAYVGLAHSAMASHPDLIVWPETSVPGYLLQDPPLRAWLDEIVRESATFHLVGAPVMHGHYAYNSAFLLDPHAMELGEYAKQHLVPFGEIMPFGHYLGKWIRVLSDLGGFAAGKGNVLLNTGTYKIGVSICYEAIFPAIVRESTAQGANILANITNDGWYMKTAAPYQHFAPNVFRAIENDRYLVRADNTGISAIIDPTGHVLTASGIYTPALVTGAINPKSTRTPYVRFGDSFAWVCTLATLISLALPRRSTPSR